MQRNTEGNLYDPLAAKSLAEIEYDLALQQLIIEAKLIEIKLKVIELCDKAGFNPDQPRAPSGSPNGGQWTDGGGNTFHNPKEPSLPNLNIPAEEHFNRDNLITALSIIPAERVATRIYKAVRLWNRQNRIVRNLEKYFGGKPERIIATKKKIVMIKGNKIVRFDLEGHGYDSHFHIQEEIEGELIDIGEHHNYFKKD